MCKSADPSQSQTNQAMGYSRKNVSREVKRGQTFLEKSLEFLGLSLYSGKFRRKQSFTFENFTKFTSLRNVSVIQKWRPMEISILFYLTPGISTCSFFIPYPWKFHVLNLVTWIFFWNSPITELCVVLLFSQKCYWSLCT